MVRVWYPFGDGHTANGVAPRTADEEGSEERENEARVRDGVPVTRRRLGHAMEETQRKENAEPEEESRWRSSVTISSRQGLVAPRTSRRDAADRWRKSRRQDEDDRLGLVVWRELRTSTRGLEGGALRTRGGQ